MRNRLGAGDPIPAGGTATAPLEPGLDASASEPVSSPRTDGGNPEPRTVLARPSASRRVPVAVIAGVEWVRLMERL